MRASPDEIIIKIRANPNLIVATRFIGREGETYLETVGPEARYRPTGEEGYIRAAVRSSDGTQAWTQPVFLD